MNGGHGGAKSLTTVVLAPALVDQSAANTNSVGVDMKGYEKVRFIYQIGGMVNGSSLSTWAIQSNESNLGNATNVTYTASNGSTGVLASLVNVANTANNSVQVLEIVRPTKRYVGVTVDAVTANITLLGILAERFPGTSTTPPTQPSGAQYVSVISE